MSADPPIPIDPDFRIQLPNFEGPLDLLLFLIQKHELDVLDLPVAFVTEKYVEYLSLMQRLNLDVAAEYLLMAATLAHIKSKSLLPPDPTRDAAEAAQEEEQDPRAELIRRLLEYQKYKKVAEDLGARGVAGRDVFTRGSSAVGPLGPAPLAELSVFKLLDAFRKIAETVKGEMALEVSAERITIQERITQIVEVLRARKTIAFEQLFAGATSTYELVVSFLALLEMAKMRMLRIYQADPDSPIHLEGRLLDADDEGEGEGAPDAHGEDLGDEPSPEAPLGGSDAAGEVDAGAPDVREHADHVIEDPPDRNDDAYRIDAGTTGPETGVDAIAGSAPGARTLDPSVVEGETPRRADDDAIDGPQTGAGSGIDDASAALDADAASTDAAADEAAPPESANVYDPPPVPATTDPDDDALPEGAGWPSLDEARVASDEVFPADSDGDGIPDDVDPDPFRPARPLEPRASSPAPSADHELDPDAHLWPLDAQPQPSGGAAPFGESGDSEPPAPADAATRDAEEDFWPLDPSPPTGAGFGRANDSSLPPPALEDPDPDRPARSVPLRPDAAPPAPDDAAAAFWPLEPEEDAREGAARPYAGPDVDSTPPPATETLDSGEESRQDPDLGAPNEPEETR